MKTRAGWSLWQIFQFLLEVHQDIGGERVNPDPDVEIAVRACIAASDGTEETDLHHMKAASPIRLMQPKRVQHDFGRERGWPMQQKPIAPSRNLIWAVPTLLGLPACSTGSATGVA